MKRIAFAVAAVLIASPALATKEKPSRCTDISEPKKAVEDHDGRWTMMNADQWQFLRGIYAMNPQTPPGLPYGDKAALATIPGNENGMVFFLDGDRACTPMIAPKELIQLLKDVKGPVSHEGDDL